MSRIREWGEEFLSSSRRTKYFTLTWVIYTIFLIATAIYCFVQ